jgi:hypothetical protein
LNDRIKGWSSWLRCGMARSRRATADRGASFFFVQEDGVVQLLRPLPMVGRTPVLLNIFPKALEGHASLKGHSISIRCGVEPSGYIASSAASSSDPARLNISAASRRASNARAL